MKYKKYVIQLLTGLLIAFILMWYRGIFNARDVSDRLLIICDSVTILAFLYLGIGSLLWVSSTGYFTIFGYAFKKCVHVLLPGVGNADTESYYAYKTRKSAERKPFSEQTTLITGLFFLVCSFILTAVWYLPAE